MICIKLVNYIINNNNNKAIIAFDLPKYTKKKTFSEGIFFRLNRLAPKLKRKQKQFKGVNLLNSAASKPLLITKNSVTLCLLCFYVFFGGTGTPQFSLSFIQLFICSYKSIFFTFCCKFTYFLN